jgi:thioredoxin-related protein
MKASYPPRTWSSLLLTALCFPPFVSAAEEVRWRHDYNAARREAQDKGRPLLLDIGTDNCYFCKKLDATTFREPALVRLLNEHFVPLKVDGDKDAPLTDVLRVQGYPTLVFAAPDGRILTTLEGYVEAPRLQEHLQRVLASVGSPEWMTRDYESATRAVAASDYARAVALLKSITEEGRERPVQVKAAQLLQDLEQQASARLARARELEDKGQASQAALHLAELVRVFPGTRAAAEGGRRLVTLEARPEVKAQVRSRRAGELLAQARADYQGQQYLCCLDRCEYLAANYADLPEGAEAIQLAAEIKSNPEWLRQACESLTERLGGLYLALAETCLKKGQTQQAVVHLERVVQAFPGTRQADVAQARLAQIQGRTPWQVDTRKR